MQNFHPDWITLFEYIAGAICVVAAGFKFYSFLRNPDGTFSQNLTIIISRTLPDVVLGMFFKGYRPYQNGSLNDPQGTGSPQERADRTELANQSGWVIVLCVIALIALLAWNGWRLPTL